ncbi:MAG: undecaprenyl diphosphate synthase family protein [Nanoarchaeota archaeon]
MKPLHIAIYPDFLTLCNSGISEFIRKLIQAQIDNALPVLTIYLLPLHTKTEQKQRLYPDFTSLFAKLAHDPLILNNQIKVSALGKWYDLPDELVESVKSAVISTKDFDGMFLNLCINYDGQDDITESAKMITRKVLTGKLKVDDITSDTVKENIYSSFFMPPGRMLILGGRKTHDGFLLWDTSKTEVCYINQSWCDWDPSTLLD